MTLLLGWLHYAFVPLVIAILKLVCLLIAIAYYTLAERKVMASFQRRVGPNVVGPIGLLQPLADGLKLAGKEFVIPSYSNSRIFIVSAMSTLMLALVAWTAIPFNLVDERSPRTFDRMMSVWRMISVAKRGGDEAGDYGLYAAYGNTTPWHQSRFSAKYPEIMSSPQPDEDALIVAVLPSGPLSLRELGSELGSSILPRLDFVLYPTFEDFVDEYNGWHTDYELDKNGLIRRKTVDPLDAMYEEYKARNNNHQRRTYAHELDLSWCKPVDPLDAMYEEYKARNNNHQRRTYLNEIDPSLPRPIDFIDAMYEEYKAGKNKQ